MTPEKLFWQKTNKIYQWALIMLVVGTGCIDEINLDGNGAQSGQLVIQGSLVKSCPSLIRVRVSRTGSFSERGLPTPVDQAQVFLEDRVGNQLLVPQQEPGVYQLPLEESGQLMPILVGNEYRISVAISEGSNYQSTWERIHAVPLADSFSIDIIERETLDFNDQVETKRFIQYFVHTPLLVNQGTKARLRWTFTSIYRVDETSVPGVPGPGPQTCFVSRGLNLDKVVVFNGNESGSDYLDGYFIVEDEIDYRYGLGFLLRIKQNSLTSEAYRYWDQVSQAVALSGGLFEASPGPIQGNMFSILDPDQQVLGYFYASEQQDLIRFVTPEQAGRPKDLCSLSEFGGTDQCSNCVSIPLSTLQTPPDWVQ